MRCKTRPVARPRPGLREVQPVAVQLRRHFAHQPVRRELRLRRAELCDHGVEVGGHRLARREHRGVVRRHAVLLDEATLHRRRQLRHLALHAIDPRCVDNERHQVRIGEIAVVVRVFLAAHRTRLALVRIVKARFLHNRTAVLDQLDLPAYLILNRLFEKAERVEVLDLARVPNAS